MVFCTQTFLDFDFSLRGNYWREPFFMVEAMCHPLSAAYTAKFADAWHVLPPSWFPAYPIQSNTLCSRELSGACRSCLCYAAAPSSSERAQDCFPRS